MDSVPILFFRYLPGKYEINSKSIPDETKSKIGKLKVIIMILNFFLFTFRLCLKDKDYVLHGHWAFPSGYISYLISKILKRKFIVTVHGSEIPLLEKFSFLKKIVINSLNKSSGVITSNNYLKNKLISMGVNEEKILLIKPIPNFVEHQSDKQKLKKFSENFTTSNNKIILFVGRLTEVKGTEYLIKSLPEVKMKNIHLIIVGDGILSEELKNLSKKLHLEDKVTFFGAANRTELGLLYDISDVFVLPSIVDSRGGTEGTGLVIPEAMESGLPIIASSVGGIVNTIKDGENGILVPEKDFRSIASAIELLISDSEIRRKIIKNSKKTVDEFSPKNIAHGYLNILKHL